MIIIPFLIFLVISVYFSYKYGLNIGSLLLLVYTFSFATSIPLFYVFNFNSDTDVSFSSMIYLVSLILLWLMPILKFSTKEYTLSKNAPLTRFNILSYFLLIGNLLALIFLLPKGIQNIMGPDILWIRSNSMSGNIQIYTDNTTLNFIISNIISFYPVSLFFFFYSITFMQHSRLFNFSLLLASISIIVFSFLYVARGEVIYWSLMYIFLYIFFRKSLSYIKRRQVLIPFYVNVLFGIIYFTIVSLARWGNSEQGTIYAILSYSGQHIINFGHLFDHFTNFQNGTLNFPFFQRILGFPYRGDIVDYFQEISANTSVNLAVFYTFIGSFFIDFGPIITFILVAFCSLLGFKLFKINKEIHFYKIFLMILYCQIPLQGIFIFNLLSDAGNKYIILALILSLLFKLKII